MRLDRILDRLLDRTRRLEPGYRPEEGAPPRWDFSVLTTREMNRFEELHVRWLYERDPKLVPRERYYAGWPFEGAAPDEPLNEEERLELDHLMKQAWRGPEPFKQALAPGDFVRLMEMGPEERRWLRRELEASGSEKSWRG